jgi:molybdate transport system substrate-binding protein
MSKKIIALLLPVILGACVLSTIIECAKQEKRLIVYSGNGLITSMEEVRVAFENKYNVSLDIIYAGSCTCLKTIQETRKGDIFVPGSSRAIKKAGGLVDNHQYVAVHVPAVCIHKDNRDIQSFDDLAKPGVRLTIGNANMCAIGRVSDQIIAKSGLKKRIANNIVIRSGTVNELLNLLIKKEVDAAIIWKEMLRWPESKDLQYIQIPSDLNQIQEIRVAVLTISEDKETAQLFADFVASEGKAIFKQHGFVEK